MKFRFKSSLWPLSALPVAGFLLAGFSAPSASAQPRAAQSRIAQSRIAQSRIAQSRSVAGELLVRWKSQRAPMVLAPSTDPARWQQSGLKSQLSARLPGARLKRVFAASGWSVIQVPAGQSTQEARATLVKSLGAANVSLNYYRFATRTPNDALYETQWQWPQIKAPDAWNTSTGSRNVVVAVLDTGIDLNHPDLQANLWKNPREIEDNGIDDDSNGYIDDVYGLNGVSPTRPPQDDNGHGTHCAGLIGAVGNNGSDLTGANWSVQIMALKFLGADGGGSDDDAIACFEYAIKMKQSGVNLRVISNSYAGPDDNPAFKEAYRAAETAGILQVSAAGNEGSNNDALPQYPSSYSSASNISVAASDQADTLPDFSNYGAQSVDLVAPGVDISSLRLDGGIKESSGTSMATPIVAGAAALVSSAEPGLSAGALKSRLMATVDKKASLTGAVVSGGRLNMARALSPISYRLKGQVYRLSGTTRVPLVGASVKLSGKISKSAATDSNGTYNFSNLPPGSYTLQVALSGFSFVSKSQIFPLVSGATVSTIDFQATSVPVVLYTLFGVARDAGGTPRAGVEIFVDTAPTFTLATTDSSGRYTIANRRKGTYSLKARGGNYKWIPTPNVISVPLNAVSGRAEVNFKGYLIDKDPPAITITSPATGATFAPGNQIARGLARDANSSKEVYLQLTRMVNFVPSYYEWTTRLWVATRTPATILTRPATGREAKWETTLPYMTPASYSLRVWGRDVVGNVSTGQADAFSSFDVAKPASSARSSAGES